MKAASKEEGVDRVYFDTNIWVSYMLGRKDKFYQTSKPMIDTIEQERAMAVVSNLIIMELTHAIRRYVSQKQPTGEGMTPSKIKSKVDEITKDFVKIIGRFVRQGKAVFVNSGESVEAHHSLLLEKLASLTGYARRESYCKKCKKTYQVRNHADACPLCDTANKINKKYKYRGLGHVDPEHVYFAIQGRASTFYTRDKGFLALELDPDFNSIVFKQL